MDDFGSSAYMVDVVWKDKMDFEALDPFRRAREILGYAYFCKGKLIDAYQNQDTDFFTEGLRKFIKVCEDIIIHLEDYKQKHPQYDTKRKNPRVL